jgi:hypothetical protein
MGKKDNILDREEKIGQQMTDATQLLAKSRPYLQYGSSLAMASECRGATIRKKPQPRPK